MIPLIVGLAMTADERCYIVGEPRQKADGGIVLDKPTYHSTVAQAVSAALHRAMRKGVADGSIATLREFIHEQNRQRAELKKLMAPLESDRPRQDAVETHGQDIPDKATPTDKGGEEP